VYCIRGNLSVQSPLCICFYESMQLEVVHALALKDTSVLFAVLEVVYAFRFWSALGF
jgi:predicted proteasome-type protease